MKHNDLIQQNHNENIVYMLREMTAEQVCAYIRGALTSNGIRGRFNMSGYDSVFAKGSCTLENQAILNKFAHLGLYDYTRFLFLDFYKGDGTVYYSYWGDSNLPHQELSNLGGETTTNIIYKILQVTVLSGRTPRRRS